MPSEVDSNLWEKISSLVESGDSEKLTECVQEMNPAEFARTISRVDPELQKQILTNVDPDELADLMEEISDVQAVQLIELLPPEEAATIVNEMESDEQADLLGELNTNQAASILVAMEPDEAKEARSLMQYSPEVAGGLMKREFLSFPATALVGDVINDLNENADQYSEFDIRYIYVVDGNRKLKGVLPLHNLLFSSRKSPLSSLMIADPRYVKVDVHLEELEDFFEQYSYLGVPVVDNEERLQGLVHREDVLEAVAERADSDHLKRQGIVGGEEIRTMPLLLRSRRRLSWLSVNILLNIVAASVIALYQDTLSAVIALAVFLPIISDMSGCSGNQAVAVSMRELSLGLIQPTDMLRVWSKELMVGVINGLALGVLIATAAWLWKGNIYLGAVVGTAMAINTVVAVSLGGMVPLFLKRMKMDPALASGPILTTVTDMCGFFFVLTFAWMALPYLT